VNELRIYIKLEVYIIFLKSEFNCIQNSSKLCVGFKQIVRTVFRASKLMQGLSPLIVHPVRWELSDTFQMSTF